jgi:predicted MFS family arabinose efflux permease
MQSEVRSRFSRGELAVLAVLFSATVIVGTGIQMGNVLFPALSRLMNVPISTVTLLVSVWAFAGLLSPLFGPPSDRYGHGTLALIGLGAFSFGNLLCAAAPSFPVLVVFQAVVGLGYAIFSFSAAAVVGDVFAYEARARAMGVVRLAVSVTVLAGVPAAAAIAERATPRGSFGTVGGLGLLVLVVALALLPRRSQELGGTQADEAGAGLWQRIAGISRQRSAMVGLLAVIGWAAIPTGLFIYLAAWLEQTFQLMETQVGLAFSAAGVGGMIGNTLTTLLADRIGKKPSALLGLLMVSVAAMLLPHLPAIVAVLIGLAILVAALEFGIASYSTLMTELVPASRGTLMSLFSLVNGIGTGMVPLAMRPVWERGGYTIVTLVLGAVGLGTVLTIGFFVTERRASVSDLG